jgi:hypothetical protein
VKSLTILSASSAVSPYPMIRDFSPQRNRRSPNRREIGQDSWNPSRLVRAYAIWLHELRKGMGLVIVDQRSENVHKRSKGVVFVFPYLVGDLVQ